MLNRISLLVIPVFILALSSMTGCSEDGTARVIIADHNAVNDYDKIPPGYMNIVKTWLVDIAGESHSEAYRTGMVSLEALNTDYAVESFDGSIPAKTSANLRLGRHGTVGEGEFFTNSTAVSTIEGLIKNQHDSGNPLHVLGFGWCWDMTDDNGPTARDTAYNTGWAGRSAGGPEGSRAWGLDSGDQAITGNSICMDTYLAAVEEYNAYCKANGYACVVVFTTGPVDGNGGTETGFQREIKHDYIRQYVIENGGFLFDYADILCYNNSGEKYTSTWDDSGNPRIHAQFHPDNAGGTSTGHIGETGAVRLAKAMWWMLARMAGWDGN